MIKQLEKLAKKNPVLLDELAHAYLESGMTAKADKLVDKYLAKYPKSVTGLMVKALAQEAMGEFEKAEALFREVLALEPRNIRAVSRLAFLENDKKNPSDYWKKNLASIDPLNPWIQAVRVPRKPAEPANDRFSENVEPARIQTPSPAAELKTEEAEEVKPEVAAAIEDSDKVTSGHVTSVSQNFSDGGKGFLEPLAFNDRLLKDLEELERDDFTIAPEGVSKGSDKEISDAPAESIPVESSADFPVELQSKAVTELEPSDETVEQSNGTVKKDTDISAEELEALLAESPEVEIRTTPVDEELEKVYQEINVSSGERRNIDAFKSSGVLKTATIAQIYIQQGKLQEALDIFNSLPDGQRDEHLEEIQWLQKRLLENEENGGEQPDSNKE